MFRKLLTLDDAERVIRQHFETKPIGVEEIPLLEAANRILAADITANLDVPPFDRSTVDGYATKAEYTFDADENRPIVLKVDGIANIGQAPKAKVRQGGAVEIATGAPIPEGADGVVMVEYTERKGDSIRVFSPVTKDENVMKAGADIKKGETVLRRGDLLGSNEIGVLAALGMGKAKVYALPRVAVLSTGPEVVEPGRKLPFGKIYDINAYSLSTAVLESGGRPIYLGVFPDRLNELQKTVRHALASADLVVTSGGVSVGPKDIMPKVLNSLGKPGVIVCGIAIKPGKPATVASVDGKPVFSLPGHPTSALLVFHLLVQPIVRQMAGRRAEEFATVKAVLSMRVFPAKGRRTFVMVKLRHDESNRLVAEPTPQGLSGAITTLLKATGFVEIAEDQQFIDADEEVTVHLLRR